MRWSEDLCSFMFSIVLKLSEPSSMSSEKAVNKATLPLPLADKSGVLHDAMDERNFDPIFSHSSRIESTAP